LSASGGVEIGDKKCFFSGQIVKERILPVKFFIAEFFITKGFPYNFFSRRLISVDFRTGTPKIQLIILFILTILLISFVL
jgi:hypothetical protein